MENRQLFKIKLGFLIVRNHLLLYFGKGVKIVNNNSILTYCQIPTAVESTGRWTFFHFLKLEMQIYL